MKRYLMISVLCLTACGAGVSGEADDDDSSLSSPLSDADDEAPQPDVALASTGDVPPLPSPAGPVVVVGAGGAEWTSPANGSIVWCHASVPVGCGASAPAQGAGRLVVVRGPAPGGEPVRVETETDAPGAGASGGDVIVGNGTVDFFEAEVAPGQAAVAIPVTAGGSLPPLPGTCVVITFQNFGAGSTAAGEDRAPVPPLPALPPPGGCLDVVIEAGSVPAPPLGGGASAPVPGDDAPRPTTPPGVPVPGAPPVLVPLPPPVGAQPGACFSVAFAGAASVAPSAPEGEGEALPEPTPPLPAPPVICAAPAQPSQPGTRSPEPRSGDPR